MADQLIEAEHLVRYRFAAAAAAGRRVLDAGCGVGRGTAILARAGARETTGVDPDQSAVATARRLCPNGSFTVADLWDLPFPEQSFDLIACFEALDHVARPEQALDELTRVLAPDGMLFVSTSNPEAFREGTALRVHDFRADQLLTALAGRFRFTENLRQRALVASALTPPSQDDPATPDGDAKLAILPDRNSGDEAHSLVVASQSPLPSLAGVAVAFTARQLDELASTMEALVSERAAADRDRARIADELRDARRAADAAPPIHNDSELIEQLQRARELRSHHEREADQARAERDQALLRLLEAEQRLAAASSVDDAAGPTHR